MSVESLEYFLQTLRQDVGFAQAGNSVQRHKTQKCVLCECPPSCNFICAITMHIISNPLYCCAYSNKTRTCLLSMGYQIEITAYRSLNYNVMNKIYIINKYHICSRHFTLLAFGVDTV